MILLRYVKFHISIEELNIDQSNEVFLDFLVQDDNGKSNIKEKKLHPCLEGKHDLIILEDIGEICRHCNHVEREMKHILPPFVSMPDHLC